ncbi:MAG: C-terminal helicase domain-containing protein, partial [Bacteroidota bacterium]
IHLLQTEAIDSVLVFSRTKHGANKIVKLLDRAGIPANAIHGNKSQNARQKALNSFKNGDTNVLVATDIAARGIDIDELSHVVNYDLPNVPETYVHRIGRTGRAGASGKALSFCDSEERAYLRDIQKTINQKIPVVENHPFLGEDTDSTAESTKPHQRQSPKSATSRDRGTNSTKQKSRRPYWKKRRPQK